MIEEEQPSGSFLDVIVPRRGYIVTPLILYANVLIFAIMVFTGVHFMEPSGPDLIKWGANFRPVTLEGEWWRLFTCCFLHIGLIHLLMNMYALVYIGALLEPLLGSTRFAVAYVLTGILASTASLWWHDITISAGASGAIFGMYGVFLAMLTTNLIEASARKALLGSIGVFVAFNLLYGIKSGIDNAAHIGGLVSGAVIGYIYCLEIIRMKGKNPVIVMIALSLATIAGASLVYHTLPNDIGKYEKAMDQFSKLEEKALEFYKLPENTSDTTVLRSLNGGIADWQEAVQLLKDQEKLELPEKARKQNAKLLRYTELRLTSFKLLKKGQEEHTTYYQTEIQKLDAQIGTIIDDLKKVE